MTLDNQIYFILQGNIPLTMMAFKILPSKSYDDNCGLKRSENFLSHFKKTSFYHLNLIFLISIHGVLGFWGFGVFRQSGQ